MSVDILPLYIEVELRVLPLLRFYKALCLFQFPFSCASTKNFFRRNHRRSHENFQFSDEFFQIMFVSPSLCFFFFISFFGLESFCFFLRVRASFITGVLVMMLCGGCITRFRDNPLGFSKVPSSGFLGLVTSGLSNLRRRISFVFLSPSLLNEPQDDHLFLFFFFM